MSEGFILRKSPAIRQDFSLLFLYGSLGGSNVFEELKGVCEFTLNYFATFQSILMVIAFKPL